MPQSDLNAMFKPRSVALVCGPDMTSFLLLRFLTGYGYKGEIYPVTPNLTTTHNLKCYPSIAAVPSDIDLALVTAPTEKILEIVRECVDKRVHAVFVLGAAFAEHNDATIQLQAELQQITVEKNLLLIGPNSAGLIGVKGKIIGSLTSSLYRGCMSWGPVSFVSQTDTNGAYTFDAAQDDGIGLDYWVSTGDEAVLGFSEFVSYFVRQKSTRTVIGYLEDICDVQSFQKCSREALEIGKPLVILKVGGTSLLHRTDPNPIYNAIFRQMGVLQARSMADLFDLARVCASSNYPKGKQTAIISTSGEAARIIGDQLEQAGLVLPSFSPQSKSALRASKISLCTSIHTFLIDPAALLVEPLQLQKSLEITLRDPGVDSVAIFLGSQLQDGDRVAQTIVDAEAQSAKSVVVIWIAPPEAAVRILREKNIPVFSDPVRAIPTLGALVEYVEFRNDYLARKAISRNTRVSPASKLKASTSLLAAARAKGSYVLTDTETRELLRTYRIPAPMSQIVASPQDAAETAKRIAFPVVMKIVSADILHKSEADAVRINVKTPREAKRAFTEIMTNARRYNRNATLDGVVVEQMIVDAVWMTIGFIQDDAFGPVIKVGMGGNHSELFRDFALRVAPLDEHEAFAMIRETKFYRLLLGFRGDKVRDIKAVIKVILRIVEMALDLRQDIAELEINPLMVMPKGRGAYAVDTFISLGKGV